VPEQQENPYFDPMAEEDGTSSDQDFLGTSSSAGAAEKPFATPVFGGYDSGANRSSGGSAGGGERSANRISIEA
jgi:flagellin